MRNPVNKSDRDLGSPVLGITTTLYLKTKSIIYLLLQEIIDLFQIDSRIILDKSVVVIPRTGLPRSRSLLLTGFLISNIYCPPM